MRVNKFQNIKSIIAWLMLFCSLWLILSFTFQQPEASLSTSLKVQDAVIKAANEIEHHKYPYWILNTRLIRRYAHIPEYIPLGFSLVCVCKYSVRINDMKRIFLVAMILCSAIALSDEILKIFLPLREFSIDDLFYDLTGGCLGAFLSMITLSLFRFVRFLYDKKKRTG